MPLIGSIITLPKDLVNGFLELTLYKGWIQVGRTRAFDMEEAISSATKLFWRGYDRTSLTDLTGALGIGAASFYFAFGSKEALFRQVVGRYIASLNKAYEKAFQAPTSYLCVKTLLQHYADVVTDVEHTPGCLVVNSSPSIHADDVLRQWLAEHRIALRLRLEERFSADLAEGRLPKDCDVKTMARLVVTLAGGVAIEAQSGASRQDLYAAIDLALKNFPS